MRKKICILAFTNVASDSRVLRQIEATRKIYDVEVVAQGEWTPPDGVKYLRVRKTIFKASPSAAMLLLAGNLRSSYWEQYYWRRKDYSEALDLIKNTPYDLIHANDLDALPVAAEASRHNHAPILFDAHEFYLEQAESRLMIEVRRPFVRYLFNRYKEQFARMITVSAGISELYEKGFEVKSNVIMNAPYYIEHDFRPVDSARIDLINHGGALPGRRTEDMINMIPRLDKRFHLNLLLKPVNKRYYEGLQSRAEQVAPGRVTFHTPVPPASITRAIHKFDIGIHMLDAKKLNHLYALPNKMFEYVMAGLCVAVTPLAEMKKIVENGQTGIVATEHSWQAMAAALNSLTAEQINQFKKNSLELAKTLNADIEMKKLMDIYGAMLS